MSQHLVLVDDTNPSIQYSGPWFKVENPPDFLFDDGGPPFENTLHGVNVSASLSFSFSGPSVTVLGTSTYTNASGALDLTVECFVDNTKIVSNNLSKNTRIVSNNTIGRQNNWVFCHNAQLQDGPHVLSVQATVSNQKTFWFDQIQYLPSSNVTLDQALLRIDSSDSAIQYSSGWQPSYYGGIANYTVTETAGSNLSYEFSGVSISWVGMGMGAYSSSLTYSIDGQTPINFTVPFSRRVLYNQVFFQAQNLSAGNHKLVVMYQDNSNTAPLSLSYFIVQNARSPSTSSSSSATDTSTVSSSATDTSTVSSSATDTSTVSSSASPNPMLSQGSTSKKLPIGAIIGGVLGGFILLLLILSFLICRHRAQKSQRSNERFNPDSDAFHTMVQPFTLQPPSPPTTTTLHSPQMILHKPSQARQPTIPIPPNKVTSTSSPTAGSIPVWNSRLPARTPLLNHSASPSEGVPLTSSRANLVDSVVASAVQEAETAQRPASPASQSGNARLLRHEDSGIRMPPAEEEIVELPPVYTPG